MSIYATIGVFEIRRFGDEYTTEIFVQAVPPHIKDVVRYLPPPVDPEGGVSRAVFFVEAGTEKRGDGQEYVHPLLMLTGEEFNSISFDELLQRLNGALEIRYGSKPTVFYVKDCRQRPVYKDGRRWRIYKDETERVIHSENK